MVIRSDPLALFDNSQRQYGNRFIPNHQRHGRDGNKIEIPLRHRCKSNLMPMSHEDKMRRFLNFGNTAKVIVISATKGKGFKSSQPDRDFHV